MLIRESRIAMVLTTPTDQTGTVVRSLMRDRTDQKGRPRSRAKDQKTLDVDASMPTVAQPPRIVMIAAMTVAPAEELVASLKMVMKGKPSIPGPDWMALSKSPMQKTMAMTIAKPQLPLIAKLSKIDRGTTTDGLTVSSDI